MRIYELYENTANLNREKCEYEFADFAVPFAAFACNLRIRVILFLAEIS